MRYARADSRLPRPGPRPARSAAAAWRCAAGCRWTGASRAGVATHTAPSASSAPPAWRSTATAPPWPPTTVRTPMPRRFARAERARATVTRPRSPSVLLTPLRGRRVGARLLLPRVLLPGALVRAGAACRGRAASRADDAPLRRRAEHAKRHGPSSFGPCRQDSRTHKFAGAQRGSKSTAPQRLTRPPFIHPAAAEGCAALWDGERLKRVQFEHLAQPDFPDAPPST